MRRKANLKILTGIWLLIILIPFTGLASEGKKGVMEKELKTEKKSLFERDHTEWKIASDTGGEEITTDEDPELYAPPPGESGDSQKVTPFPVDGHDCIGCLVLACCTLIIWRKKKKPVSEPDF